MSKIIATKSPGEEKHAEKFPHTISRSGSEFLPSNFGDYRGTGTGWAEKLPAPSKKGKE